MCFVQRVELIEVELEEIKTKPSNEGFCSFIPHRFYTQISIIIYWRVKTYVIIVTMGWRGGSIGSAPDSRSKGLRFESRQEHMKKLSFSK